MRTFEINVSPTGVAHVYQAGKVYCSIHHVYAGGVTQARERAEHIKAALDITPELLAVVKELQAVVKGWSDSDLNGLMTRVSAVIAKAEGGAA